MLRNRPQSPVPPVPATPSVTVGADAIVSALEAAGVEICFGIPGGAVLPLYDAIARGTKVRHVLARHEQGAGHMAQGYARATGRAGVVLATSGPGATNLATPIADAQMDSTPLVCVTGQVRQELIGTQAFQECDIVAVARPLVKRAWQVRDPADLADAVADAVALAEAGRPGPVLVDVPRDVQEAAVEAAVPAPPRQAVAAPVAAADVEAVLAEISRARRPVLYVGGGCQGAASVVGELAEATAIPVVTTLMGKGVVAETHRLFAGWPGMHGARWANLALNRADLLLALGVRFDDRVTGRLDAFAPDARIVHVDADARELGKIRAADVAVRGDVGRLAAAVLDRGRPFDGAGPRTAEWLERIAAWRERFPLRYGSARPGVPLKPQRVLERLAVAVAGRGDDVVWTTGVGQHQMWAMQYLPCERPRSFVTSGGHGTMGFGLPAAIGAKAARPEATVVCVDGDGSFQMNIQELATAVSAELPVVVAILNNGHLGMVHQWQSMFYDERLSHVDLASPMPDYAAIARGYGAFATTVADERDLDGALDAALSAGRTAVLDLRVDPAERCYPIIPPGAAAVDQVEWPGTGT